MSTARDLIAAFLDCLRTLDTSADRCVDLFADDGVFEFPYFKTLGLPWRYEGREAIREVVQVIGAHFSSFALSDIHIHETTPGDGLFVEYHSETVVTANGVPYVQDYVSHLVAERGRIKLLREYLNVVSAARVLLPNGLADIPPI